MAKLVNPSYPTGKSRLLSHWHKPEHFGLDVRLPLSKSDSNGLLPPIRIGQFVNPEDPKYHHRYYWIFGRTSSRIPFATPELAMRRADEFLRRRNYLLAKDEEEWERWVLLV